MTTCFVTGCGGFVGSHLSEWLLSQGCSVAGTVWRSVGHISHLGDRVAAQTCDIIDGARLTSLLRSASPAFVFHVAAATNVQASWRDPCAIVTANVLGTVTVLEAVREACPDAVVQILGSAQEYGANAPDQLPVPEGQMRRPTNPYGLTKLVSVEFGQLYALRYGMRVHAVRPFQFIGPRKYPDACSEFAKGIVAVERGRASEVRVGSLDVVRDLLDVRDGVQAMWLIAQRASPREIFNICSGTGYRLMDILQQLKALAHTSIAVRNDPERARPLDVPVIVGDNSKLRRLGWQPQIPIGRTLAGILEYWRSVPD